MFSYLRKTFWELQFRYIKKRVHFFLVNKSVFSDVLRGFGVSRVLRHRFLL